MLVLPSLRSSGSVLTAAQHLGLGTGSCRPETRWSLAAMGPCPTAGMETLIIAINTLSSLTGRRVHDTIVPRALSRVGCKVREGCGVAPHPEEKHPAPHQHAHIGHGAPLQRGSQAFPQCSSQLSSLSCTRQRLRSIAQLSRGSCNPLHNDLSKACRLDTCQATRLAIGPGAVSVQCRHNRT